MVLRARRDHPAVSIVLRGFRGVFLQKFQPVSHRSQTDLQPLRTAEICMIELEVDYWVVLICSSANWVSRNGQNWAVLLGLAASWGSEWADHVGS